MVFSFQPPLIGNDFVAVALQDTFRNMHFSNKIKLQFSSIKTAEEIRMDECMNIFLAAVNWIGIIVIGIVAFFTGVPRITLRHWNMTLYCEDETFNKVSNPISNALPLATILIQVAVIVSLMTFKIFICGPKWKHLHNIFQFFLGILINWYVVYGLQGIISYPNPSFYQNEQLRMLYCCKGCPQQKITSALKTIDIESRGSFPSFTISAISYCSVFAFALIAHFDKGHNFVSRLVMLFVPGLICVNQGFLLWLNNINHLPDIIVGAFIGIILAAYVAFELFLNEQTAFKFTENFFWAAFQGISESCENLDEIIDENEDEAIPEIIPLQEFSDEDQPPPYSTCI